MILEIPALPVMAGSSVTLRCRTNSAAHKVSSIYRTKEAGWETLPPVFTIQDVQKSDEGQYRCSAVEYDMMMMSEESRLTVSGICSTCPRTQL